MIVIIVVTRERERERNKAQDKQVMPNKFAHHLLTDAQPVPEQRLVPPTQLPTVYMLSMIFYGIEYPLGKFRLAVLATLPPCACPEWQRVWEAKKFLTLYKHWLTH